jgi:hypothetical protein
MKFYLLTPRASLNNLGADLTLKKGKKKSKQLSLETQYIQKNGSHVYKFKETHTQQ